MQINTQFSVGDSVFFLQDGEVFRRQIRQIQVEVRGNFQTEVPKALIIYYFVDAPTRGGSEIYKYETEVGATVEELFKRLPINEPRKTT